jgi:hypothetical protein
VLELVDRCEGNATVGHLESTADHTSDWVEEEACYEGCPHESVIVIPHLLTVVGPWYADRAGSVLAEAPGYPWVAIQTLSQEFQILAFFLLSWDWWNFLLEDCFELTLGLEVLLVSFLIEFGFGVEVVIRVVKLRRHVCLIL